MSDIQSLESHNNITYMYKFELGWNEKRNCFRLPLLRANPSICILLYIINNRTYWDVKIKYSKKLLNILKKVQQRTTVIVCIQRLKRIEHIYIFAKCGVSKVYIRYKPTYLQASITFCKLSSLIHPNFNFKTNLNIFVIQNLILKTDSPIFVKKILFFFKYLIMGLY